jgi:hypothetical protein
MSGTHGVLAHDDREEPAHGPDAQPGFKSRESLRNVSRGRAIQKEESMKTIADMIKLALMTRTRECAQQIVKDQVSEMVEILGYTEAEARRLTLINIGYYTGYLDHETADTVMELFETEHPVFGRTHPTPQEAFRLGKELGEQMKRRTLDTTKES